MWCIEQYIPHFMECMYHKNIKDVVRRDELIDMFGLNQISSKKEILKAFTILDLKKPNALFIGSWMGYLTHILCKDFYYNITELELDKRCKNVSENVNYNLSNYIQHITNDANFMPNSFYENYDTVINLSTEHMTDEWFKKINKGTNIIIQSNNFSEFKDHINCVYSLDDLKNKFNLSEILYESTIKCTIYDRYTLAGIK